MTRDATATIERISRRIQGLTTAGLYSAALTAIHAYTKRTADRPGSAVRRTDRAQELTAPSHPEMESPGRRRCRCRSSSDDIPTRESRRDDGRPGARAAATSA